MPSNQFYPVRYSRGIAHRQKNFVCTPTFLDRIVNNTSRIRNKLLENMINECWWKGGYPDIDPGPDAILTSMSDKRIMELTMKDIDQIPGAVGVSNHMGSLATENQRVMRAVMMILRQRGLFWVDSRTTIYTVFAEIAQELGVKAAKIDHLLDPEGFSKEQIEQRLFEYCLGSRGKPAVILNAHVSDTILSILAKDIPVLKRYGVKFIWVSEAIRRKAQWHRKSQKI